MLYHPSGMAASLSYGNGHIYSSTLTNLMQPKHVVTGDHNGTVYDRWFTYDARGLITQVDDDVDPAYNMTFGYEVSGSLHQQPGFGARNVRI